MDFNRFDVSTKELVWADPVAWLRRLGVEPDGPVEVIDSDITALTAAADKVIRVDGPEPFLVNIELQSGHDSDLERTLWFRQVALDHRSGLPVLTILVLLSKGANSPSLDGLYERFLPDGRPTNRYHYQVVRLWKEPVDSFLDAGAALVPLAPLADIAPAQLPELVRKMSERINPLESAQAAKLWTASYYLMGLRFHDDLIVELLEGVQAVKESTTYQRTLREGRAEGQAQEAQRFLLRLATKRFGEPGGDALARIKDILDADRLEVLGERMLDADLRGWDDLLGPA